MDFSKLQLMCFDPFLTFGEVRDQKIVILPWVILGNGGRYVSKYLMKIRVDFTHLQ